MLVTYGEVAKGYRGHIFSEGIVLLGALGFLVVLSFLGSLDLLGSQGLLGRLLKGAQPSFHLFTFSLFHLSYQR